MEDTKDMFPKMSNHYSMARFSDSVPTEIQLQSLLKSFEASVGEYVVLLVTPTPGSTAIANFDTTVWPAWIRSAISNKLLEAGGVRSEWPLQILQNEKGNPYVLPVKKQDIKSTATTAEPATDDDDPKSNPISSSKLTEQRPDDTSKKCQQHDWHTNGLGITYCWNCQVEQHPQ